jgi:hypothetical protein
MGDRATRLKAGDGEISEAERSECRENSLATFFD